MEPETVVDAEEDAVLSVPVDSSQFEAADAGEGTEEDGDAGSDTAAPVATTKPKKAAALKSKDKEKLLATAAAQLEAVRAEQAVSQRARLAYLLGDAHSDFFQHFLQHAASNSAAGPSASASASSSKPGFGSPSRHRPEGAKPAETTKAKGKGKGRAAEAAEEPAGEAEFELSAAPRLTRQPKCIMGSMRDYQLEGLNWMIGLHHNGLNGILADEMGLGKTLQTISLIAYCYEYQANLGPHIVLVPKSTLANWQKEFKRWCPVINTLVLQGEKDERARIIHENLQPGLSPSDRSWNVLLTTYEVAVIEKSALIKLPWQYLVIDEAHRIKNENSALAAVVRMFVTAHRLLITGTPLQNNLHELWALLNFLLPDVFSSSEAFDSWFNLTTQSKDEEAKAGMVKQLHRVLKPFMLRRLKVDVAKALPPKTETLLYVGFTRLQRELYRSILMRNMDAVLAERAGADKTRLANLLMHLRKACNHPYLMDGVEDRTLDPMGEHLISNCAKLQLLDKLLPRLQNRGSRCLIFSQMTMLLDILEDYCLIRGYKYCRIDGSTDYEDREASIENFNAPGSEKFLFLLSTRAGGLGINLATADVVILYDSDWNPQVDLQAQDRAHRIGQTKPVTVYRLITEGSVEEKVVERALMKLKLDAVVVQQGRLGDKAKALSKEDMQAMITFGADSVVRSMGSTDDPNSCVTDADIDSILETGKNKTKNLTDAVAAKVGNVGGGLLDFKIDTGSTQHFEGVDYSTQATRKAELERTRALKLALAQSSASAMGDRASKRAAMSYNEQEVFRALASDVHNNKAEVARLRLLLPVEHRPPGRMDAWMLLDAARIREISAMEISHLQEQKETPTDEPFSEDLIQERAALIEAGFPHWRKNDFQQFVKATAKNGRRAFENIAAEMSASTGKSFTEEEIRRYCEVFWVLGPLPEYFGHKWKGIASVIERGETRLNEAGALSNAVISHIARYDVSQIRAAQAAEEDEEEGSASASTGPTFIPVYRGDPFKNLANGSLSYTGKLVAPHLYTPCTIGSGGLSLTSASGMSTMATSGPEDAFAATRWTDGDDSFLLSSVARQAVTEQVAIMTSHPELRFDPEARNAALAAAAARCLDGENLRHQILRSERFRFDYWMRSRSGEELVSRTSALQRNVEKGCVELFRKADRYMIERDVAEDRARKELIKALHNTINVTSDASMNAQAALHAQLSGAKRPSSSPGGAPAPAPASKVAKKTESADAGSARDQTAGDDAKPAKIKKTVLTIIGGGKVADAALADKSKLVRQFPSFLFPALLKSLHGTDGGSVDFMVTSFLKGADIVNAYPAGSELAKQLPTAKVTKTVIEHVASKVKDGKDTWKVKPQFEKYVDMSGEDCEASLNKSPLTFEFEEYSYPRKPAAESATTTTTSASGPPARAEESEEEAAPEPRGITYAPRLAAAPKPAAEEKKHRPRMMVRGPPSLSAAPGPSPIRVPMQYNPHGMPYSMHPMEHNSHPPSFAESLSAAGRTYGAPHGSLQALSVPNRPMVMMPPMMQVGPPPPSPAQLGLTPSQMVDLMRIVRSSLHLPLPTLSSSLLRHGLCETPEDANKLLQQLVFTHPSKPGGWFLRPEFVRG